MTLNHRHSLVTISQWMTRYASDLQTEAKDRAYTGASEEASSIRDTASELRQMARQLRQIVKTP